MASYKARLRDDLERWIAQGLIPAESREPILADVAEPRRLEASSALAAVGGLLLGVAVIAFVAANWNGIPRIGRFGMILVMFLGVCGGAAWCSENRPMARNILILLAGLVYAAGIGLTGQIFDIAGDPYAALRMAGLAAGLLALAGRSSAAAIAALVLFGMGDSHFELFSSTRPPPPWLLCAAPAAVALAWAWKSKPLAHASAIAAPIAGLMLLTWLRSDLPNNLDGFAVAAGFAGLAAGARWLEGREDPVAGIFYGWWAWAALGFFAASGFGPHPPAEVAHRVVWLALAAGVVALGLHDRRTPVAAGGVLAMAGAIAAILFDLGLGLMTAAGVFALVAVLALVAGFVLRRRAKA